MVKRLLKIPNKFALLSNLLAGRADGDPRPPELQTGEQIEKELDPLGELSLLD